MIRRLNNSNNDKEAKYIVNIRSDEKDENER